MSMQRTPPDVSEDPTQLLIAMHAVVEADAAPPGMTGTVAIGVDDGRSRAWWNVRLGDRPAHEFEDFVADDADAALLLGPAVAASILATGEIPAAPDRIEVFGDDQILERFVRRYFVRASAVDVRATAPSSNGRAKRRRRRDGKDGKNGGGR